MQSINFRNKEISVISIRLIIIPHKPNKTKCLSYLNKISNFKNVLYVNSNSKNSE
jgi:hypothetical protein